MIDTSSNPIKSALKQKKNKKALTYKGVKIQSDNEEEANNSSSDGQSSKDSAEEYFK